MNLFWQQVIGGFIGTSVAVVIWTAVLAALDRRARKTRHGRAEIDD